MEEKKFYTQTEVAQMFNKSLSNLAFYKKELNEKGYMVEKNKKSMITKEGVDFLTEKFKNGRRQNSNTSNFTETNNKNVNEKLPFNDNKIIQINEKEVSDLQKRVDILNATLNENIMVLKKKDDYYIKQAEKWQNEAKMWQQELEETKKKLNQTRMLLKEQAQRFNQELLPAIVQTQKKRRFPFFIFGK